MNINYMIIRFKYRTLDHDYVYGYGEYLEMADTTSLNF